jgi:L-glyceraldehyde 3-phosphate reductase
MASTIIGASRPEQIEDSCKALSNLDFSNQELQAIEDILDT